MSKCEYVLYSNRKKNQIKLQTKLLESCIAMFVSGHEGEGWEAGEVTVLRIQTALQNEAFWRLER